MHIKILAVGKIKNRWISEGIKVYQKRLPEIELIEIKDSNKNKEFDKIISLLKKDEKLVVLSEKGDLLSSVEFAEFVIQESSQRLVFIIGGYEGLSEKIQEYAYKTLSLSKMTFTHEMARLFLVEQIYRAKTIIQNHKYHK